MGDFESNGAGSLKNNAKCKVVVREYKKKRANKHYNTRVGIMDAFL